MISGKSQTDAFWDVWAEHPNNIAFALVVITLLESKFILKILLSVLVLACLLMLPGLFLFLICF